MRGKNNVASDNNLESKEATTIPNIEKSMKHIADVDRIESLQKMVSDFSVIVANLNQTVTSLSSVVQQQQDRLRKCEICFDNYENRLSVCEFEDVSDALASIEEAREFSVDCISSATVNGLEKIVEQQGKGPVCVDDHRGSKIDHHLGSGGDLSSFSTSSSIRAGKKPNSRQASIDEASKFSMKCIATAASEALETIRKKRIAIKGTAVQQSLEESRSSLAIGADVLRSFEEDRSWLSLGTAVLRSCEEERSSLDALETGGQYSDISRLTNEQNGRRNQERISVETCRRESYREMSRKGDAPTYPEDCYSLLAIYSPIEKPKCFFYGFFVFMFQISFLILLVWHGVTKYHSDNPIDGSFLPVNVTWRVRITQLIAIGSYLFFADASLRDFAKGVEQFPTFDRVRKEDDCARKVLFSCLLRMIQGLMAILVAFLLILTSDNTTEIILNFTAVNFISHLDECAFELAKWGKWGISLQTDVKRVQKIVLPYYMYHKNKRLRHLYALIPIFVSITTTMAVVIYKQQIKKQWTTMTLRIQFGDSGLEQYSGCYHLSRTSHRLRESYYSNFNNKDKGAFTYCRNERQWVFYDNENDSTIDPCEDESFESSLARSKKTELLDISSVFEDQWSTAVGIPIDMYFFEADGNGDTFDDGICSSFLNDGVCDASFNKEGYRFDNGDCCASTCNDSMCGRNGALDFFGSNGKKGIGFPDCKDAFHVPVTIHITDVSNSRDRTKLILPKYMEESYYRENENSFWEEEPVKPLFDIKCDGKTVLSVPIDDTMKGNNETIFVWEGAECDVFVRRTTSAIEKWDNKPIWYVDYAIYEGQDTNNVIVSASSRNQDSSSFYFFPSCYIDELKRANVSNISTVSTSSSNSYALKAMIRHSECEDEFLTERFALFMMNSAAIIKSESFILPNDMHPELFNAAYSRSSPGVSESGRCLDFERKRDDDMMWISPKVPQCQWDAINCDSEGSVHMFSVRYEDLLGTISPMVGLLTGLTYFKYDNNNLTGTIPSEFGQLTKLLYLDIDKNRLTGTIPTELGLLTNIKALDLDENELTGTIPSDLGKLERIKELDLVNNNLSGCIPSQIYDLTTLILFEGSRNKLNGTIQTKIGFLQKLERLLLSGNKMKGTIPTEIGKLNLTRLDLSNNNFSGLIPTEIGLLTSLEVISLYGNALEGPIPSEIGALKKLKEFRLENNQITGTIPTEVASLRGLINLSFDSHNLSENISNQTRTKAFCDKLCDSYDINEENDDRLVFEMLEWNEDEGKAKMKDFTCAQLKAVETNPEALISIDGCKALKECVSCRNDTQVVQSIPDWVISVFP